MSSSDTLASTDEVMAIVNKLRHQLLTRLRDTVGERERKGDRYYQLAAKDQPDAPPNATSYWQGYADACESINSLLDNLIQATQPR